MAWFGLPGRGDLQSSNILLVAAIDIAGLAVAFPVGVGLALVLGVITTYLATPTGNVPMLALGVGGIVIAILWMRWPTSDWPAAAKRRPSRALSSP